MALASTRHRKCRCVGVYYKQACEPAAANRLMRMFGGQVFRRDLPQNLLAAADARCFATATTNGGTGGYGVMACVRVTSLSPLEKNLYETGVR